MLSRVLDEIPLGVARRGGSPVSDVPFRPCGQGVVSLLSENGREGRIDQRWLVSTRAPRSRSIGTERLVAAGDKFFFVAAHKEMPPNPQGPVGD